MRIVVIRNEPPWPLSSGGKLHAFELCRRLAERHELLMLVERAGQGDHAPFNFECRVAGDGVSPATDCCPERRQRGSSRQPQRQGRVERYFGVNPRFGDEVVREARRWRADLVLGMNYLSLAHLARISNIPTVCDMGDDEVLHRLLELRGGLPSGVWTNMRCLIAAFLYERRYLPRVAAVTVLSEADRRFCRLLTGHPRVEFIPHGVDDRHYRPASCTEDDQRIVFWGGLDFGPNLSAVRFFARQVFPLIRRQKPQMRWSIIGRGDSPALRSIRQMAGVEFMGFVEDIRPHVASAAVVVVPMVTGSGIKNKILEAWAMGKAVVCTPRALGSLPGEHGRNVWVAGSPCEFAAGVLTLSHDVELRRSMGTAARTTVSEQCTWEQAAQSLETLCLDLVRSRRAILAAGVDHVGSQETVSHAAT